MTSRRSSPHRKIIEISRFGPWGNVRYKHELECGHAEILQRASRAQSIACSFCNRPPQQESTKIDFSNLLPPTILDTAINSSQDEIEIQKLQAHLASALGIPAEAISMISSDTGGRLIVKAAYVFLSAADIRSIIDRLSDDAK